MHASASRDPVFYLWFDTEFTSLVLEDARLLQVALVVTDAHLNRLAPPGEDLVLCVRLEPEVPVSAWTEQNLGGLLAKCRSEAAIPVENVDERLEEQVTSLIGPVSRQEKLRPYLAGNSVHADWWLARRWLPRFSALLHYRHLDISSLKLQWLQFYGGKEFDKADTALVSRYAPVGVTLKDLDRHDAYYDVVASMAELAYYRERLGLRDREENV